MTVFIFLLLCESPYSTSVFDAVFHESVSVKDRALLFASLMSDVLLVTYSVSAVPNGNLAF